MYRSVLLLLLSTILLISKERVEIFAKHIVVENNSTLIARKSVIVLYDENLIKADKAVYNRETSILKLSGKVEVISRDENRFSSDKLILNLVSKVVNIDKIFLAGEQNLWIDASNAKKYGEHYKLKNSRISSCDKLNPDWTIEFSKADYYRDREVITMEDAKVRFYDTTIVYLPYLAFPTVHKRTTGLLYPRFKITTRDGLTYEQPYFYAPEPNWDIEIDPQVRWKRGAGGYITARFVDSNHSSGYIRAGYFKNKDSYAKSNHLNGEHKGVELLYQSTDFLNMESYKSGLYINGTGLNDREYLNLQKGSVATLVNSNLVESRFNSFIYDNANYFGLYGKYNIDISRESNSETIQELPSIQYHRYMQKLFDSSLFYSFDMRLLNSTREKGSRATQTQIDLPVTYYNSFFNNYLDISISENIYLDRVDFSNIDSEYKNYYYFYRNYHKFNISSDLVKRYGGYSHTVHPEITYIVPSRQVESPTSYEDLNSERQELFVTNTQEEQLSIGLGQYLFDENSNMNLMHTIKYSHYPKRTKSKGDIVNEFEYKLENITFYNNLKYAWDEEELHSLTTSLLYNQNKYDIMLMHFYNNDFLFTNKKTSFLQSKVMHRFGERDSWFVNFDYDLRQEYNHQWSIGWSHTQKCWSSKLSLGQEVVPNLDSSFRNTALYIELNLNPIGGIQQNIEDSFSSQGVDR